MRASAALRLRHLSQQTTTHPVRRPAGASVLYLRPLPPVPNPDTDTVVAQHRITHRSSPQPSPQPTTQQARANTRSWSIPSAAARAFPSYAASGPAVLFLRQVLHPTTYEHHRQAPFGLFTKDPSDFDGCRYIARLAAAVPACETTSPLISISPHERASLPHLAISHSSRPSIKTSKTLYASNELLRPAGAPYPSWLVASPPLRVPSLSSKRLHLRMALT